MHIYVGEYILLNIIDKRFPLPIKLRISMRFGISLFGHHPLNVHPADNFRSTVTLARCAVENGFHLLSAGHHYMMRNFQKFQTMPAMARLAAEAPGLHINLLELVPLNHPVRIAEQLCTLDAITDGKVVFTAALGYSDKEFASFGIPKRERLGRFIESLQVIKRLWTEDDVTFHGKYYQLENAIINPKPVQKPRPPIWVTADATKGVIRAAENGDVWLMSNHTTVSDLRQQLDVYEQHFKPADSPGADIGVRRPLMRILSLAPTKQQALNQARPDLEATWKQFYGELGQAAEMDDPDDFNQDFDSLWKNRFLIGTPDEVTADIEHCVKILNADLLMVSISGPLETKLRTLNLFGKEVMPHFI
jgi:alkanesulfonate monooxygenase SsuD/methylene tetrahydromethanopterin reductase-like flavin-dependent oxidoreductase (luciferase family)